jgi:hypothetical protein
MSRRANTPAEFVPVRPWRRLRWLYLGALGAIGAVLTLGERLETLFRSKAWMYVYIVVDLFKIEIVTVVVLLLIWDVLRSRPRSHRSSLVAWIVIALVAGGTLYQARFYVAAKRVYLRQYPLRLALRAEKAFIETDRMLAELHLMACIEVLRSEFCGKERQRLQTRAARADQLRDYVQHLPRGVPIPVEVLETAFLLDRNRSLYERQVEQVVKVQTDLTNRYLAAIKLVRVGDVSAARSAFADIQRAWQGFGDCHLIARELAALESNAGLEPSRTPYVAAVKRYGPEEFVRRTLKLVRPRAPDAVLKEGPTRLMTIVS